MLRSRNLRESADWTQRLKRRDRARLLLKDVQQEERGETGGEEGGGDDSSDDEKEEEKETPDPEV